MRSTTMLAPRRWGATLGLGVIAALTLAACAPAGSEEPAPAGTADESPAESDGEEAPAEGGTLKVGYIAPITGNFAVAGQEMVDGWKLFWEINGTEVGGGTGETIVEELQRAGEIVEDADPDVFGQGPGNADGKDGRGEQCAAHSDFLPMRLSALHPGFPVREPILIRRCRTLPAPHSPRQAVTLSSNGCG